MVIPPFFLLFKTHSTIPASFKLLYQNSNTKLIHFYKKCYWVKGKVKMYEYKFVEIELKQGFLKSEAKENYRKVIQDHAKEGWR
mgnify:CR=1 FL=1